MGQQNKPMPIADLHHQNKRSPNQQQHKSIPQPVLPQPAVLTPVKPPKPDAKTPEEQQKHDANQQEKSEQGTSKGGATKTSFDANITRMINVHGQSQSQSQHPPPEMSRAVPVHKRIQGPDLKKNRRDEKERPNLKKTRRDEKVGLDLKKNRRDEKVGLDLKKNRIDQKGRPDLKKNRSDQTGRSDLKKHLRDGKEGADLKKNRPEEKEGPDLKRNHPDEKEGADVKKNHPDEKEVPDLKKNHPDENEGPDLRKNHPDEKEGPDLKKNHTVEKEGPDLKKNHPEEKEGPDLKKNHPEEKEGPDLKKNHPDEKEGPDLKKNHPVETEGPSLKKNHPDEKERADLKKNHTVEKEGPGLKKNHPNEKEGADLKKNRPHEKEGADLKKNHPDEKEGADLKKNHPDEKEGPDLKENRPEEKEGPDLKENRPDKNGGPDLKKNLIEEKEEPDLKENRPNKKGVSDLKNNRTPEKRGRSHRRVLPAPPHILTKEEATPTSKRSKAKSVQPAPKSNSARTGAAPRSNPVSQPAPGTSTNPILSQYVFKGRILRPNPSVVVVQKNAMSKKSPFRRKIGKASGRKKATNKKNKVDNDSGPGQAEDKSQVEELMPEFQLLQDVDEGKIQEGFTAKIFRREKTKFVKTMLKSTYPIRRLLKLTGRFPFSETFNGDGTITYEASMYRPQGIYFMVVSVIVIYLLFIGCFNLMNVMLNITIGNGKDRSEECENERMFELALFDRNIVGFAGLWTALCHITLTSVNLYFKRHYVARYLSFWTVAAQIMHVDVAAGIFKYSLTVVIFYVIIMGILTLMTVFRLTATVAGMPSLFSILMFRIPFPCILQRNTVVPIDYTDNFEFTKTHYFLEIISGIFLIYIYVLSKVLIMFFLHFCRMLVTTFKSWNSRFHAVLNYPDKFMQSVEGRTTYELLFEDHCTLLSLIEGTDRCFSTIVESYLALQLISITLETYLVYRNIVLKFGEVQMTHQRNQTTTDVIDTPSPFFIRKLDFIPGFIILLSNVIVLVAILKEAGKVNAAAREGLEVIRKKTMMGRKSDQELWFTLSMYFSYCSHDQLSLRGSGFFEFDNAFILTVIAIMLSNLVTTIQFAPSLDPDYRQAKYNYHNYSDDAKRELIGAFIRDLEKLDDRHWIVEDESND